MDEEISIIDNKTKYEKLKTFFIENKKVLAIILGILIFSILCFFSYKIYSDNLKKKLSDKYNEVVIKNENGVENNTIEILKEIINQKDSTYSPLALYYIIDNNLVKSPDEINELFDVIIEKTPLEKEIKNLVIYKKGLYNADFSEESKLLDILKPLINSKSVWKSHALYLMAEYFYSKNENQKAKDFYLQIMSVENANKDIILEAQKRLNRDLSE